MNRSLKATFLLLVCAVCFAQEPPPIEIVVGAGKALTVTIPYVRKDDVAGIVATFFGKGDERAAARFRELLKDCSSVTLTITSKDGQ